MVERGGMNDDGHYGREDSRQDAELFNTQEAEIVGIMVRLFGCEAHQVTRDATLESLGADSLDGVEMTMDLEEHFDIEISDEEAESVSTVADVFKIVKAATDHEADATIRPVQK